MCVARKQTSSLVYSEEALPKERSIHMLPNKGVACTINEQKAHLSLVRLSNHWTENKWQAKRAAGGLHAPSQNWGFIQVTSIPTLYVLPSLTCFRNELLYHLIHLLKGFTRAESMPVGQETLGLQPMADNKGNRSQDKMPTLHARGHLKLLLRLGFRVGLTVCVNFSLPSQMHKVRPDWQCSGERLSAQIDFFAPWGVDMLHLTGRWLSAVCLPC